MPKLKKSVKKMFSFRRKRNSILSLKTFWPNRVDLKLLKNSKFISKISKKGPTNLKKWSRSSKTTSHKFMLTNLRLRDLISRLTLLRSSTSTVSKTKSSMKIWKVRITVTWTLLTTSIRCSNSSSSSISHHPGLKCLLKEA